MSPPCASLARCELAVCGVMPASRASSPAVSARPSINADSMLARAGSPIRAATGAMSGPIFMLRCLSKHALRGNDRMTVTFRRRPKYESDLLHPLHTRPLQARGLRGLCAAMAEHHPGLRRRVARVLDAARGHRQQRAGDDLV